MDQMMGPVGISEVVAKTNGVREFIYMLALISLSLGVTKGVSVTISADGPDEEEAVNELIKLVTSNFVEEQ